MTNRWMTLQQVEDHNLKINGARVIKPMGGGEAKRGPKPAKLTTPKPKKYGNHQVVVDDIGFDSKAEAKRYGDLKLLQTAGEIEDLLVHPKFVLDVNGVTVCTYTADFSYFRWAWPVRDAGEKVIEDVKSVATRTTAYRLKKRLMKAVLGIDIQEIMK